MPLNQSKSTETLNNGGASPNGPAGTPSNLPPGYTGGTANNGQSTYKNTKDDVQNGVDYTKQHTVVAPGAINKMDVALLVDKSVSAEDLAAAKTAVEGMVGLDPSRGDTLNVASMAFAKPQAASSGAAGLLGDPFSMAKQALAVVVGALIFLFLVRKNLRRREGDPVAPEPKWLREIQRSTPIAELGPSHSTGNELTSARRQDRQRAGRGARQEEPRPGRDAGGPVDERVATMAPEAARITGRKKAAVLLVALGKEGAAEVFKHLSNDMIEQLTVEMAKTSSVEPATSEYVLEEFIESTTARGYMAEGGLGYAREVLERAVGSQRAGDILSRLSAVIETSPFDYLRSTPPDQIAAFLRNEHPQTIALVVAQLPTTALGAKVMELLTPELQADVATRIAQMGQTSPDVVKEVAVVMEHKLETVLQREYAAAGGVRSLASILNSSNRATERNILDHLQTEDADLAEEVRRLLFVFEDILKLDDRAIQMVLREVDSKDLALAMRGSTPDVQEKILSNMSSRGSEMLREEMEFMPPQRRRVVEEAQTKIVAIVRKLEDAGEIVIARAGGDEDDELIG